MAALHCGISLESVRLCSVWVHERTSAISWLSRSAIRVGAEDDDRREVDWVSCVESDALQLQTVED